MTRTRLTPAHLFGARASGAGLSRRTRSAAALAGVLMAAGALSACGSSTDAAASSSGPVTITFWDDNGGPDRTPLYQHLIAEFEASHPNIKVDYVGLPTASAQQKYDTAIAGGSVPDVGSMTSTFLSDLVGQGALIPLEGRLNNSPLKGKLQQSVLTATKDSSPDRAHLYALPFTSNVDTLWYRTDLISTPPTTWDDFFTAAKSGTDPAKNVYGFTLRGGAGGTSQLVSDMYAYSGITDFFDKQGKSTINDPKMTEAVSRIAALYKAATSGADLTNGYPEMVAEFDGGHAAMMQHNLGSYTNHLKALGAGKFGGEPLPGTSTGKRVLLNSSDGFGVFKASRHQDQAFEFVEFLLSKQSNSYWNQNVGQIPTNTDAQKDQWVKDNQPISAALKTFADPKTTLITPPYYLPQFGTITNVDMAPAWQQVLLGKMTPADFTAKWAQELTQAQASYEHRGK